MLVLKGFRFFIFLTVTFLIFTQCTKKTSAQYVNEGRKFTRNAKYNEALKAFKRAIELNSRNPDAHYGLGGIYNQRENYHSAKKAFSMALELDPTYVDAYYSLGYTYERLGKDEEAQKYFSKYKTLKKKFSRILEKEKLKS